MPAPPTPITSLGHTAAPLLMRRTRPSPKLFLLSQSLILVPIVNLYWIFPFLVSLTLLCILVSWDHLPSELPLPKTLPQVSLKRSPKYGS